MIPDSDGKKINEAGTRLFLIVKDPVKMTTIGTTFLFKIQELILLTTIHLLKTAIDN